MKKLIIRRNILFILFLMLAGTSLWNSFPSFRPPQTASVHIMSAEAIQAVYLDKRRNLQMEGSGTVIKLLPDDIKGSRHQRILLRVAPELTVLIAHNIDLAPRVHTVKQGDTIYFSGEYEWNEKGGVIHWTHHDPQGRHPDGWLRHNKKIYQ
jgi:hypothetical protein